jgi:hypothetical protein
MPPVSSPPVPFPPVLASPPVPGFAPPLALLPPVPNIPPAPLPPLELEVPPVPKDAPPVPLPPAPGRSGFSDDGKSMPGPSAIGAAVGSSLPLSTTQPAAISTMREQSRRRMVLKKE